MDAGKRFTPFSIKHDRTSKSDETALATLTKARPHKPDGQLLTALKGRQDADWTMSTS